jgi:hypothetical protein
MKPIDMLTMQETLDELDSQRPAGTDLMQHMQRRRDLWRRLDALRGRRTANGSALLPDLPPSAA